MFDRSGLFGEGRGFLLRQSFVSKRIPQSARFIFLRSAR